MDDPVATAVLQFIEAVDGRIAAQDLKIAEQATEIRSLRDELLTRSAPQVIEGPPGPAGPKGEKGDTGDIGPRGEQGEPGTPGPRGSDGAPGERGADGINGRDGANGIDGRDGKDGIATREELDSLIESRFADLQVRSLADTYEGVWKEGLHKRGNTTTWGGSLWLVVRDSEKKPGENNDDYKLIVKRGADAKR